MIPAEVVPPDALEEELHRLDARIPLEGLSQALDAEPRFPRELFREMGAARLLGLTVPVELGGRGLPVSRAARLLYRLAFLGGTLPAKLALQPEFCSLLVVLGDDEQRKGTLEPLMRGEILVGNQITEPSAGSDFRAIQATARRTDSGYRIEGTKSQAAFAADAETAIVLLRVPEEGTRALGSWLVPQELPGVVRRVVGDHGERWMRRGTVEYHSVDVPVSARLGAPGTALSHLRSELSRERALLAAIYLGVARRSWEETVEYVARRESFDVALSERQAVSFPLVEDWVRFESAWRQLEAVLAALETGAASDAATALIKWYSGEVALEALEHCVQFHGGMGYSRELPHERRLRDVRSARVAHGTAEIAHLIGARALWPRAPGQGKAQ
ncbi:MAG: acyl-CoA/acyl-ACP dehydrogenase [Thermoplasmata archaeon]|nr:acyl-CoA/acyl-ACP dehydrogenase [Thermoplasmata archaeon]